MKTYRSRKQRIANPFISAANRIGFLDAYSLLKGYLRSQVVILMYHRVGPYKDIWSLRPTYASDFEDQIRYLGKTHKILPLRELAQHIREKRPLPKRTAIITFDDGYKDVYIYAYPILKKYNVPATIFLTTGHIGTGNLFWWDKIGYLLWNTKLKRIELDDLGTIPLDQVDDRLQSISKIREHLIKKVTEEKKNKLIEKLVKELGVDIPPDLGKEIILSWHEVKEMNDNGIDFGAHTVTHPILTGVSSKQARAEITQSKREIERRLDQPVTTFSYPNGSVGDFDGEITNLLKESGFTCAVTTVPRLNTPKTDLYELGRLTLGYDFGSFKFFVSGLYPDLVKVTNIFR